MQIIQGTTEFELCGKSAVSIGKFDGIHLGHQKLLGNILEQKEQGQKAVVFTFDPPPSVLFGRADDRELMTKKEKRMAFEQMGIDVLIEFPLTVQTAATLPEDFIEDILVKKLHAEYIAAGPDVSFGDKGAGNYMLLRSMAGRFGYQVEIIDKIYFNGREISSTYVREELEKGNMEMVAKLLGAPYGISETIAHGNSYGRTIGMPTANLLPSAAKLLPPRGVYYSEVFIKERKYAGITNIGYKPTVSDNGQMGVETFIYEFDEDIYGEEMTIRLLSYKRPEKKFDGKDALKEQMMKDIEEGKAFHFGS
ncbi:riboflavin kinase/FMN adenylyltransferase [Kineothrix alysoides]|uniref:Riboflavin biosynthesis protein n=1 Tax=Kineothrix alysoides TaxID=1469948 RepID=A0A4V2QBI6_9FIRM|nr:riboflavin biosynthesis protein RibF [Kineothrix alysoides]TCL56512.1 riboflavin kinase/FMN adenylyltransferase [Kineothrix alysoides]